MPGVTCAGCGHATNVSFRRGVKLSAIACPECGKTELRLRSAGQPNRSKGRTYEKCIKCGRRGLHHKHLAFEWTCKYSAPGYNDEVYPAGTPCCWFHEPVPASRTSYAEVIRALTARLGPASANLWATAEAADQMEACARPVPAACPICTAADLPERGFHTQAYAYQRGTALVAICDGCCHTIELATLVSSAASAEKDQGAGRAP